MPGVNDQPPHDASPTAAALPGPSPAEEKAAADGAAVPAGEAANVPPPAPATGQGQAHANGIDGFDNLTKLSLVGIAVGLLLVAGGIALHFLPFRPPGLGNMPILVACVGLGAVLAGLGSQARYIANEVALGGGVAIAMVFYLTFVNTNGPGPDNRYEGILTVLSGKAGAISASLWISNDQAVEPASVSAGANSTIFKFNLSKDQVKGIFDTFCSRFEIQADGSNIAVEFDPSKLYANDFFVVMRMNYSIPQSAFYYYDKRGLRRNVPKQCPPAVEVAEKSAVLEDVRQASLDKPPAAGPTTTIAATPANVSPQSSRWSYFGIRSEAEAGFTEKTFDIVARAQGSPAATASSVPLRGDILLALVDVRVREGARRLVAGTANQWINPPLVGVVKAGERVKVIDHPRIANSVSYWVPISDKID